MANEYHYSRPPKAIPGFITLTKEDNSKVTIALHAITTIRSVEDEVGKTILLLLGTAPAFRVQETHSEVMSLIHQAQHPAT